MGITNKKTKTKTRRHLRWDSLCLVHTVLHRIYSKNCFLNFSILPTSQYLSFSSWNMVPWYQNEIFSTNMDTWRPEMSIDSSVHMRVSIPGRYTRRALLEEDTIWEEDKPSWSGIWRKPLISNVFGYLGIWRKWQHSISGISSNIREDYFSVHDYTSVHWVSRDLSKRKCTKLWFSYSNPNSRKEHHQDLHLG